MDKPTKSDLDKPIGGLFLMTIFTLVWAIIAEIALNNRDYRIFGIIFLIVLAVFVYYYFLFSKSQKSLTEGADKPEDAQEKKQSKWFMTIFGIEGFAILIVKNVLVNINYDELFVSCFALIVGLHFIPLAVIFKRKFDNYLAAWICIVAIIGIILTIQKSQPEYFITALVAIGCAIGTAANGIRLIDIGKKILNW